MVETQEQIEKDLFICLQDIQILREKLKMYERDQKELQSIRGELENLNKNVKDLLKILSVHVQFRGATPLQLKTKDVSRLYEQSIEIINRLSDEYNETKDTPHLED